MATKAQIENAAAKRFTDALAGLGGMITGLLTLKAENVQNGMSPERWKFCMKDGREQLRRLSIAMRRMEATGGAVCLECGKPFTAGRAGSKFCSAVCRVAHHRKMKRGLA